MLLTLGFNFEPSHGLSTCSMVDSYYVVVFEARVVFHCDLGVGRQHTETSVVLLFLRRSSTKVPSSLVQVYNIGQ